MKQSISALLSEIAQRLDSLYEYDMDREQIAWWLIQAATHKSKAQLIGEQIIELSPAEERMLDQWLYEHIHDKKPLQYILGNVPFGDLILTVRPPILIPRPETEEWVIDLLKKLQNIRNKELNILDLCTGSGAIALALARGLPQAHVTALDISQEALKLAQENATQNALSNVSFVESDLFEKLPAVASFDLIVSNPPYISFEEYEKLDPMVLRWEDKNALLAEDNGLAIINKIIASAPAYLRQNQELLARDIPQLYIEVGYQQAHHVMQTMRAAGYKHTKILTDLEGKERVVVGNIPYVEAKKETQSDSGYYS